MPKSPIERANADQEDPRQPRAARKRSTAKKPAAPAPALQITDVIKARKAQDAALRARLKVLDREISKLVGEYDQIAGILGVQRQERDADAASGGAVELKIVSDEHAGPVHRCADCGSTAGPNAKNECNSCGAFPFEQAL